MGICCFSRRAMVLCSCSPGNTVGLLGQLAVTCHMGEQGSRKIGTHTR